jgi:hypothetical protein
MVTSSEFSKKSQLFHLNFRFEHGVDYLSTMIISNEKYLNYKVLDLVYNSYTKLISIGDHTKKL